MILVLGIMPLAGSALVLIGAWDCFGHFVRERCGGGAGG